MELKRNSISFSFLILYFFTVCVCGSLTSPVSYRDGAIGGTTTLKIYNDQFKMQDKTIPPNLTNYEYRNKPYKPGYRYPNRSPIRDEKDGYKYQVKSVLPGEKTLKQCDEDENEYTEEGPQENCSEKTNKQPVVDKGNQVPMMIIHKLDMLAMRIPMNDMQKDQEKKKEEKVECKEDKKKEGKDWSEWSPCSRRCGDGQQSRWRYRAGISGDMQREHQVKPGYLTDYGPPREHNHLEDLIAPARAG